jgi:hypothetical protein
MIARALKTMFFGTLAAAAPLWARVAYPHPGSYFESGADLSEPEQLRIREHLERVEADLRAAPPRGLSPAQTEARARRLDDLRAYRLRGEFPRNPDYPDSLVPYFIDARGVACAVGQLVIASGQREFAEEIARTRNHAYIREIEDGRLAAWAEASGLTLEECARIQPSYGGPITYPYVLKMEVSPQGGIWALAGEACLCQPRFQTVASGPGGGWTIPYPTTMSQSTFCLDPQGRPLIGFDETSGAVRPLWDGSYLTGTGDASANDCAWTPDGSGVWVAGNHGLREYRLLGSDLSQVAPATSGDSMLAVAASDAFVWGATAQAVFGARREPRSVVARLDSAGGAASRITGMAGQGADLLWAGVNGRYRKDGAGYANDLGAPIFSRQGLLLRQGLQGAWKAYTRAASGLPSDTIQALAPADSPSVWIATAGGIFRFTPPNTVTQARAGFDAPVTGLATDSLGRLYIATWGQGVYRFENGATRYLAYYSAPSSIFRVGRGAKAAGADPLLPIRDPGSGFRTLLGRKTGSYRAEGVIVSK